MPRRMVNGHTVLLLGFTRPHSVVTSRRVETPPAGEQPDDGDEQRGRLPALNSPSGGHHSQERLGNQVPRSGHRPHN